MVSMSLVQPSQKAPPGFGPAHLTVLMGRADDLRTVLPVPVAMQTIACKAFVSHIDALCRSATTEQTRRRMPPSSKEGLRQRVVVATGWCKAKTGNHAGRGH